MELKFKTFYKGQLIDCHIDTSTDLVISVNHGVGSPIGYFKAGRNNGVLPLLEIFQSTGKMSKDGLIYRGHIIKSPIFKLQATVFWNELKAGFYLDFGADFDAEARYQQFDDNDIVSERCEILGHITDKTVTVEPDFEEVN